MSIKKKKRENLITGKAVLYTCNKITSMQQLGMGEVNHVFYLRNS